MTTPSFSDNSDLRFAFFNCFVSVGLNPKSEIGVFGGLSSRLVEWSRLGAGSGALTGLPFLLLMEDDLTFSSSPGQLNLADLRLVEFDAGVCALETAANRGTTDSEFMTRAVAGTTAGFALAPGSVDLLTFRQLFVLLGKGTLVDKFSKFNGPVA